MLRNQVQQKIIDGLVGLGDVSNKLNLSPNSEILLLGPHADDSFLGLSTLIQQWRNEGHLVIEAVTTPGYAGVSDRYALQLLNHLKTFKDDVLYWFAPKIEQAAKDLAAYQPKRPRWRKGDWIANMNPWDQMDKGEQDLRARLILSSLKNFFDRNKIEFNAVTLKTFIEFVTSATLDKPKNGAKDIVIMQWIKSLIRHSENVTAMVSLGVSARSVNTPLELSHYTSQTRGPAASEADLLEVMERIEESHPSVIVSVGENETTWDTHSMTQHLIECAVARLIDQGKLDPEKIVFLQYADPWGPRVHIADPTLSLVTEPSELRAIENTFPQLYPSQEFPQQPYQASKEPISFADRVTINAQANRSDLLAVLGNRVPDWVLKKLQDPNSGLRNFRRINLKNSAVRARLKQSWVDGRNARNAKNESTNEAFLGPVPGPKNLTRMLGELRSINQPMADALAELEGLSLSQREYVDEVPGGRWPIFKKYYDWAGPDWFGQDLLPSLVEGGFFIVAVDAILAWMFNAPYDLSASHVARLLGLNLLWQFRGHSKDSLNRDKNLISLGVFVALALLMTTHFWIYPLTSAELFAGLFATFVGPHFAVNRFFSARASSSESLSLGLRSMKKDLIGLTGFLADTKANTGRGLIVVLREVDRNRVPSIVKEIQRQGLTTGVEFIVENASLQKYVADLTHENVTINPDLWTASATLSMERLDLHLEGREHLKSCTSFSIVCADVNMDPTRLRPGSRLRASRFFSIIEWLGGLLKGMERSIQQIEQIFEQAKKAGQFA